MITGDYITGTINGTDIGGVQKWSAQGKVIRLNGQTAEDEGFSHPKAGTRSVTGRVSLVVDITTGSLVVVEEGTEITNLGLWADAGATDPIYDIPKALVLGCSPGGGMGETFQAEIEFENQGPFTFNDPN